MAKATITVIDTVNILSTSVNREKNMLEVEIDREWLSLSGKMIDRLFDEAYRIGTENHPTLEENWTPHFFCERKK
jgi:hypothetical protein